MSMPSYWYGAGPDFSGLNNAYASQAQVNNYNNQQAAALAQANSYNPWANTPGGFGAQTAYYAGQGAAYGRAVPASSQAAVAAQNPSSSSVFDTGTTPYNAYGNPSLGAGQPNYFSGATPISPMVGPSNDPASMAYYQHNPDVAASGQNAFDHWKNFGQNEGRQSFGVENVGAGKGMDWNSYFNTVTAPQAGGKGGSFEAEYLLANPDVAAAAQRAGGDVNAFADQHFQNYGEKEGRRLFDANAYLQQNPDVWAAGANPFQHYNQYGRNEGRAAPMSGTFDARWYGEQNPDVLAAGMDPTAHWLQFGQNEGRAAELFNRSTYTEPWQAGIPQGRNNRDTIAAVIAASQSTGLHPNALSALFGVESVWDPRSNSPGNPNWGVPQLSADMWGDSPFNGVINGKTWEQYKGGTAADQIGVFADWLNKSGSLTRGGLDFAAQPPEMQFALLMGNQLGGHYGMDWRNRIAAGDMTTPVYQGRAQAGELGNLSPSALIGAYDKRVARWPTQQTNWGP